MSPCPSEEDLARFVDGQSSPAERERLQAHLDGCADCRLIVASAFSHGAGDGSAASTASAADSLGEKAAGASVGPDAETRPDLGSRESPGQRGSRGSSPRRSADVGLPERGTLIGRYFVLERLGAGGMGTVHAAYDPVLDRRVALKLLRADVFGADGQELLLREAKVLASFGHPNVLTVHDSGTWEGRVFLAMELVEGGTLRDWARADKRPWQELVRMMATVGEGLAAAHRAGFVHRDFKPENVLVGSDGRPRITDFGLAVRAHTPRLSDSGSGLGTPLFMAPEQMEGAAADARTDIFAFGVTLHLLLYGVRPFAGDSVTELHRAIRANEVADPPRAPRGPREQRVPGFLRALVLRCIRARPDERPASMEEVLAVLRSDPGRQRRRLLTLAGLALLAVGIGVAGDRVASRRAASCASEGALPEAVWGTARRGAMEAAFTRTGLGYARTSFEATARLLDDYARGWSAMRVEACEATRVRRQQPEETMALRVACLDDRRRELAALAAVLTEADRAAVEQAPTAASALTPVTTCADVKALAQPLPRPRDPAIRARLEAARAKSAEADARLRTGGVGLAATLSLAALEELRPIDHAPTLAYAEHIAASAAQRMGRFDEATRHAQAAIVQAQRGRDDSEVADSAKLLTQLAGLFLGRTEEGLFYSRLADATAERRGNDPYERSEVRGFRSLVLSAAGRHEEALEDATVALAEAEKHYGPSHLSVTEARSNRGVVLFNMGHLEEAQAQFALAVRAFEQALGAGNPEVLPAQSNLGVTLLTLGRLDEAAPVIEAVLAHSRAAYGEQGSQYAIAAINAGELRIAQRRFDEAIAFERQAIAILEPSGAEPTALCEPLTQVALAELGAGRAQAALAPIERALRHGEGKLPPTELAKVQLGAARVLSALGRDPDRVRALCTAARTAWADAARRFGAENQQRVDEIDAFVRGMATGARP